MHGLVVALACLQTLEGTLALATHLCLRYGVLCVLLIMFAVTVSRSPSLARQQNALALQGNLRGDRRFSSIDVEYMELKSTFLRVDGQVDSDRDFDSLRQMITRYDWHNMTSIHWAVTVSSPPRLYQGWDDDLFGGRGQKANTPQPQSGSPPGGAGHGKAVD